MNLKLRKAKQNIVLHSTMCKPVAFKSITTSRERFYFSGSTPQTLFRRLYSAGSISQALLCRPYSAGPQAQFRRLYSAGSISQALLCRPYSAGPISEALLRRLYFAGSFWGAGMAQWLKRSPPSSVARVR